MHINSPTNYGDAVEEISERMDLPSEVIDVYCWLVGWLVGKLDGWLDGWLVIISLIDVSYIVRPKKVCVFPVSRPYLASGIRP